MAVWPIIPGSTTSPQPPPTPEPTPDINNLNNININMTLTVPPRAGNAGIAGALKACLDILSEMCCVTTHNESWPKLQTKLDIERTLLLQWTDKVKLLDKVYDGILDDHDIHSQIMNLLHATYAMLKDRHQLRSRFDIMWYEQEDSLPDATYLQSFPILSKERLDKFNFEFARQSLRVLHVPDGTPSTTRILRVALSEAGFEIFTGNIRQLVDSLNRLTDGPNSLEWTTQMAREDVKKCKTMEDVRTVREASKMIRNTIHSEAENLILQMAGRRVLANLRFEGMNERKMLLQKPHPGTFEWALKAPEPDDAEWDSLAEWLESGSGIYWVCGKAGAGKSTFLKHIFKHPETKRRLAAWGGDEPVSLGSYFFWKLGKDLQRTRDGMARAVLYHILRQMPHLIPLLAFNTWQFAYTGAELQSHESLPLPSVTDVREAFATLAKPHVLDRKFCFIVDGLDEYSGDFERAVDFVRRLSQSPKIKVLVSSRPTPVFIDSFTNSPKLRLHDLVAGDVLQYVQDKSDTHRYMRALREVDETMALILVETLAEKAGGVFLWTVLATRILLKGFDNCERFVNLEKRIAKIPEELEDLFPYVLDRVEPCHREQVAKLLRMCYRSKGARSTQPERLRIWNMGLTSVDEDLEVDDFERRSERALKARHRQCLALETRLAARCGGLLEVVRSDDGDDKCFCPTPEEHPHLDALVDSSIEFLHRTVYEWYGGLDSWALSQLEFPDNDNDGNGGGPCLPGYSQQLRMALELGVPFSRADVDLANCMHYVKRRDKFSPKYAEDMLRKIRGLVDDTRRKRGNNWYHAFCCSEEERDTTNRLETLYFAVAMGLVNLVRYLMKQNPEPTLNEMEKKYEMSWWKVAADRTLIKSLLEPNYETVQYLPPPGPMQRYLESSGCTVADQEMRFYLKRPLEGSSSSSMALAAANPI